MKTTDPLTGLPLIPARVEMAAAAKRSRRVRALSLAFCVLTGTGCTGSSDSRGTQSVAQPLSPAPATPAKAIPAAAPSAPAPSPLAIAATDAAVSSAGTADLGPDAVEDGILEPASSASAGSAATSVGTAAAGLLSSDAAPAAPAPDQWVTLVQRAQGLVPPAAYSLGALAAVLPSDPSALDTFVRDDIGIDLYDGVLRGALGTWLGRAGDPLDKLLLLAAVLRSKHVAFQFVRGTLSDAERAAIIAEAKGAPRYVIEPSDARQRTYLESRAAAGRRFAAWIAPKLGSTLAPPPDFVSGTHYWIRASAGGKSIDLDPTLKSTAPGAHLGTEDTAGSLSSALPQSLYATVDVRLRASDAGGKTTTVVEAAGRVADIALAPIHVVLLPAEDGRVVTAMLVVGARSVATKQLAPLEATHVQLEITRTSPGGVPSTISRAVYDAKHDGGDLASYGLQVHTIVLYPESAPDFVAHVEIGDASVLAHGAALRRAAQDPGAVGFYPKPIADFIAVDDAMAATLGANANIRLYRDRADVVMLHTVVQTGAAEATVHSTFDIGDNGMAAAGDKNAEVATNLARGWADTWIEKDIMGPSQNGAMDRWLDAKAQHVAFALASSATLPTSFAKGVAILQSGADPATAAFWWDVDPTSGSAVGRGPGGYGQLEGDAMIARYLTYAWRTVKLGWTLAGIYSTAKDCLSDAVSGTCAIGIVGAVSTGLGALGLSTPATMIGRVGTTASVLSYGYATLTSPGPPPAPDPTAPNACGMMCAPGDPSVGDGDGPE